jgi:hypothetical protein
MNIPTLIDDANAGAPEKAPFHVGAATGLTWANAERTAIACMASFPNHPMGLTAPMPFVAHADDAELHGRVIFSRCKSGEFGPIGDFVGPTNDDLASAARSKRDELLAASQWLVDRHRDELDASVPTTLTAAQFAGLQAYRQALRSITDQSGFPTSIDWPVSPL